MKSLFDAVNGRLDLDSGTMDYIRFGRGRDVIVMIPGVGDGLKTVRGTALAFSLLYRKLAKKYTVYVFSRINELPVHCTTREMAADLAKAMGKLGLEGSFVLGVSQGGMIAQWLAIDHPELVGKLILTVTLCRPNPVTKRVISGWIRMAKRRDHRGIMVDTAKRSHSPRLRWAAAAVYGLTASFGRPESFRRFMTQAESCVTHDAYHELGNIRCRTLVIGGGQDEIVTGAASIETASQIPDCRLYMYDRLGHALYSEAGDFPDRVDAFFGDT